MADTEKIEELTTALKEAHKLIKYLQGKFITMEKHHDHAATYTVNVLGRIENVVDLDNEIPTMI